MWHCSYERQLVKIGLRDTPPLHRKTHEPEPPDADFDIQPATMTAPAQTLSFFDLGQNLFERSSRDTSHRERRLTVAPDHRQLTLFKCIHGKEYPA